MRYIDADALIKKIYPMGIGDGKYTINAKAVKLAIDNIPTSDVVPRSEVEELTRENESLAKTVNEASELIRKLRSKVEESKTEVEELKAIIADHKASEERLEELYSNAKAEVAREIFGDVKKAIKEEVRDYCSGFESMETPEMQEYYKTKQNTAIYLYMKIDYLEKKYTEEKKDENQN